MRRVRRLAEASLVGAVAAVAAVAGAEPVVHVADASQGCRSASGRFVALTDPGRGILLLSGEPFAGGRELGSPGPGVFRARVGGRAPWEVAAVGVSGGDGRVWGVRWAFRGEGVAGCVSFDRVGFASEGDLASYVVWLTEVVYGGLPDDERASGRGLHLGDRTVRLQVIGHGYQPLDLEGREGSTRALRWPGSDRTWLLLPVVLDADEPRVAVRVAVTDGEYFSADPKHELATVVVTPEAPAEVDEVPFAIGVVAVERAAEPTPAEPAGSR